MSKEKFPETQQFLVAAAKMSMHGLRGTNTFAAELRQLLACQDALHDLVHGLQIAPSSPDIRPIIARAIAALDGTVT